jgi:(p)ppGpp synthase/HD superfamily hydrolase
MTLEQAIALAALLHEGQRDKSGAPYVLHPLRVMCRFKALDEQRVAVLHDVMEDCGMTREVLLRRGLPECEVEAIEALSKRDGEHGSDEGYVRFIERVARNALARRVKLADLEDNLDTSRLGQLTFEDRVRLARYERARAQLQSIAPA